MAGSRRVEGVYVARVDENKKPIPETEEYIACDTLLLSVGLLPENELTRQAEIEISPVTNGPAVNQYMQTSVPSVFACGNVVHVNDLVDNVTTESLQAGKYAALYAMGQIGEGKEVESVTGNNVRYLCPQRLREEKGAKANLFFRVLAPELDVRIEARCQDRVIASKKERRVNPGEMCSIQIPLDDITDDVIINVVKEA
ncbi:FAD-dependent oxidoreductase [Sporofaciens sp. JLR.KK001]|uniref:FAD-dependent oxidoreductase n=1 Tax=Sporofaciens sp. JLR.KK001 TaxID=3112621 RepID=UPI002FF057E5